MLKCSSVVFKKVRNDAWPQLITDRKTRVWEREGGKNEADFCSHVWSVGASVRGESGRTVELPRKVDSSRRRFPARQFGGNRRAFARPKINRGTEKAAREIG